MITLHTADNERLDVNPAYIASVYEERPSMGWSSAARSTVRMADGTEFRVRETANDINEAIRRG